MNEDKELLLLAAKAVGYNLTFEWEGNGSDTLSYQEREIPCIDNPEGAEYGTIEWNPLTDDGDAFRLAASLNLKVDTVGRIWIAGASNNDFYFFEVFGPDKMAYIRRAIINVAAELGKNK